MAFRVPGDAKAAAAVMVTGSAAFLAGAFMPVARVFAERDPQRKRAFLQANSMQWRAEQRLFAAGTAVLPAGVVLLARQWEEAGIEQGSQEPLAGERLAQAAALAMTAGAGLFLVSLEARYRDPDAFALGHLPSWPFYGYTWLSLAGMAALGGALLARSAGGSGTLPGQPRWPGWLNLGGAGVFAGALAATGDLPPLLIYGVELATGAALLQHLRRSDTAG